ncbi:CRISPR type III-A/MTUBE-associated RAMP protein Csm5 [Thermus thermophilus]|uniref:type III-A CRISPR-associated RAMP protein Csm5 n=1 Tax=Thermus thermophilus TaxID=274 RepID=UPI00090C8C4C|nr:type III-A CRISPR-associated RAMP protein Csm5 [Thermus thermophilus]BAW02894.1 CRISPR type III-A/MTUBE-associated RAMP protein Csm5 [Thermus thermophilus]BDB11123.1 type III-A CRISPR-associated RAMP protein Csm5 [Thermus thermophilus]
MGFLRSFRLELEALSPVHVGTGEAYPAYAYVPDFGRKEVHLLDPGTLLLALPEARRRQYLEKVAQGPKAAQEVLRHLLEEGQLPREAILHTLPASKAFLETLRSATEEALLEYRPLPRSPLGAYLPGSSVKGALRTAWLFHVLVERDQVAEWDRRAGVWRLRPGDGEARIYPSRDPGLYENQAFEGAVLGYAREGKGGRGMVLDLYRDPFRAVRLADSGPTPTFLNRLGVFHPGKDTSGMALLAETFRMGTRFALALRYHEGLGVSMPVPPEALVRALRDYYGKVAEWEEGFAEEHGLKRALEVYRALRERLRDPEAFPLRVGFGSGRLALRLALLLPEDHPEAQEPKTRKTAGAQNPVDGYPLGWMVGKLEPL